MEFYALVIDSNLNQRHLVSKILRQHHWQVTETSSEAAALQLAHTKPWSLVFFNTSSRCDIEIETSIEYLRKIKTALGTSPRIVVISREENAVQTALTAVLAGATDHLLAPLREETVNDISKSVIGRLLAADVESDSKSSLVDTFRFPPRQSQICIETNGSYQLIGRSAALQQVIKNIAWVVKDDPTPGNIINQHGSAQRPRSWLLTGETGTGKELIARLIHSASNRKNGPFVPVNCSSLTTELAESVLFGHERGAFTGALCRRKGEFEQSLGGTIFLDEITKAHPSVFPKLLRVLQDGEIKRLGGEGTIKADFQVIAATNLDLTRITQQIDFPQDLYYRLAMHRIIIPPLRERLDDIPPLADYFARKYSGDRVHFTSEALGLLQTYQWPGNVRELENEVIAFITLAIDGKILAADIREHLESLKRGNEQEQKKSIQVRETDVDQKGDQSVTLADLKRQAALEALQRNNGCVKRAASEIGVSRPSFYKLIRHDESKHQNVVMPFGRKARRRGETTLSCDELVAKDA